MVIESNKYHYVNNQKGTLRPNVLVNLVLASILISFAYTPILLRNVSDILKLAILGMWAFTAYTIPMPFGVKMPKKVTIWWGIYAFWLFAMCIIGHSDISINYFIVRIPLYAIPFVMVVVIGKYNIEEKLLLWKIILIVFVVNLVFNMLMDTSSFDNLDKLDATTSDKLTNAGGTVFVVLCLFMIPIMWILNRNSFKPKNKFLSLVILFLALFHMTIQNNRATSSIVLLIMVIGFWVVSRITEESKSHKRLFVLVFLLLVLLFIFIVPILQTFLSLFDDSSRMNERINDLVAVSEGGDIDTNGKGSLGQRYLLWMASINTFFSSIPSFLFGIGEDGHQHDFFSLLRYGVGEHSEIFDMAARYGLVGLILMYNMLSNTFRYFKVINSIFNIHKMLDVIIVGFIVYSTFNGTFNEPTLYLFLVFLPLTLVLLYYKVI